MAIVTILAYARNRANTSLRSDAMRLSRMLNSIKIKKEVEYCVLSKKKCNSIIKDTVENEIILIIIT